MSMLGNLLFGRWAVESTDKVEVSYAGLFASGKEEAMLVTERNERSGKRRAFVEFIDGRRKAVSLPMVDSMKRGAK